MKYEDVAQRIALSHELIQTKPLDRLDFITKTSEVKQIIMNCIAYLDQLYHQRESWFFSEDDCSFIHQQVCVSAVPLLDMVEYFIEKAESEADNQHLAV
ncbi:MAG: hypothetical protein ACW99U_21680 [Candidatus Thorarchaeota archaeon]